MKNVLLTLSLFFVFCVGTSYGQDCATCRNTPVLNVVKGTVAVSKDVVHGAVDTTKAVVSTSVDLVQATLQAPKAVVSSVRYNSNCGCAKRGFGLLKRR